MEPQPSWCQSHIEAVAGLGTSRAPSLQIDHYLILTPETACRDGCCGLLCLEICPSPLDLRCISRHVIAVPAHLWHGAAWQRSRGGGWAAAGCILWPEKSVVMLLAFLHAAFPPMCPFAQPYCPAGEGD